MTTINYITTETGVLFFASKTEAFEYASGKAVKVQKCTYSAYFNKVAINDRDYEEGTEEYRIHSGECDSYGYSVSPWEGMVFNATQHQATPDQKEVGIQDLEEVLRNQLKDAITFPAIYDRGMLESAAIAVERILWSAWDSACFAKASADENACYPDDSWQDHWYHTPKKCMIGGMPSFMPVLEAYLKSKGWQVGYACTDRVSVDVPQPDGSIRKTAVFKHVGMYWA